ncbi:hypothetical protein BT96DRAFT_922183 [Gymnopus androsaceus JB14]|uniref:Ribosomal RNA methyltransferase FtsJ domain-containing protein n=1 Tax=Gymnopus androsaceus JB14 TaxID=1447944 RepID=A0A6A4HGK0_9AGAR|nr:hypothetical protein BT96DRAFT_922183 [Gymnopus androsaceus JB14]
MPTELQSLHVNSVPGWGSDDLQHLKNLKRKNTFATRQQTADNAGPELQQIWLKKMKKIMNQIDNSGASDRLWVVPFSNRPFRFLDLGCCPGGFSTYILKKNKECTSVGLSLDPTQGGHPYLLEESLRARQTVIFADMTTFHLGENTIYPDDLIQPVTIPMPEILLARDFDLVLLDAHHLRNQPASTADLLAISQVLIALLSIKFGGTIVMKLASPDTQYTATMLFMLDMLSTFYVIARGVGGKPDRRLQLQDVIIPGLKRLWESRDGRARRLLAGDLDFIIDNRQLEGYGARLNELCSCVWQLQASALEA